jgi:hypothetical protein
VTVKIFTTSAGFKEAKLMKENDSGYFARDFLKL